MRKLGFVFFSLVVAACSEDHLSSNNQAVTGTNGVWQNGLTTNGVWQNGVWQNGVWQNGVWQNGVWQNGVWQNGVWQNGVWQNGVWQNGIAHDAIVSNPYTRVLLQYVYACAMPGALDPVTNTAI